MSISTQTRALLLLTGRFAGTDMPVSGPGPLDEGEWGRLVGWLKKRQLPPDVLLSSDAPVRLEGWSDPSVTLARLLALLQRRPALLTAIRRWEQAGIWAIGRTDPDYPKRLKRRLRTDAPSVLFGHGDGRLLNQGGIALIGGGLLAGDATAFAQRFAGTVAAGGLTALTTAGGAIEEAALRGSLAEGGQTIVVLTGGLMRAGERFDQAGVGGRLVLVSTEEPDALGHHGPAAEDCLYGLSDAALLVGVERDGPRWAAATCALERDWVPLWVQGTDQDSRRLLRLGAHALPSDDTPPRALLSPPRLEPAFRPARLPLPPAQDFGTIPFQTPMPGPSLVGFAEPPASFPAAPRPAATPASQAGGHPHLRLVPASTRPQPERSTVQALRPPPQGRDLPATAASGLFGGFLAELVTVLADNTLTSEAIAERLELTLQQTRVWLRRAAQEGRLLLDPAHGLYALVPDRQRD